MRIGVPTEVKPDEFRVAATPAGVRELTSTGHEVLVQAGAGSGSHLADAEYVAAGATIVPSADDVWAEAELVLKVKEPIAEEYGRIRAGPDPVHLPASGGQPGVHRRAARQRRHGDRVRDGPGRRMARCRCSRR